MTRRTSPVGRAGASRAGTAVHAVGELLITLGVVVLLFVVYALWFTGVRTAQAQDDLEQRLEQAWQRPLDAPGAATPMQPGEPAAEAPDPGPGDPVAVIRIPRFGPDYGWVVVEGVSRSDLMQGPGHYPGTALPGEVGNVVISGHRTTYGSPFSRLGELERGDEVRLEVRSGVHRYGVVALQVVDPGDVSVIQPVPGEFGATPTRRLLTLTTCHPRYSAAQRLIVTAELLPGPEVR